MADELQSLLKTFAEARELGQQGRHEEARQGLQEVQQGLRRLGLRSAEVLWHLAVANDYLGNCERALALIRENLLMDPMSTAARSSQSIIANNARKTLADPHRAPDAEDTPRLYQLLVDVGEADTSTHVAMAKHHLHAGLHVQALALLEAVVVLAPANTEAWQVMAAAARACERRDLQQRATAALVSLGKGVQQTSFLVGTRADA